MFQLTKIHYGRDNVPEPITMPATAGVTYKIGIALYIDTATHTLKVASGDKTASYIALEDKTAVAGDKLLCYRVLPQMLFEVPITQYSASTVVPGGRLQFSADGASLTATAASGYAVSNDVLTVSLGATVLDTMNAVGAGDRILVTLA